METQAPRRSRRQAQSGAYRHLPKLALGGGLAFWAANFATSLAPIAAEYRAALSISYLPMVLVEASLAGLAVGCLVSYFLIRLFDKIPTETPILKAEILSIVALAIAMVVAGVGASRLETSDALRYFLIGALLNVPRFLILGIVIGYLYKRLYLPTPDSRN